MDSKPKPNKEFLTRLQYLEKRLERELKESNMKSQKDRREEFNQNISAVNNKKKENGSEPEENLMSLGFLMKRLLSSRSVLEPWMTMMEGQSVLTN